MSLNLFLSLGSTGLALALWRYQEARAGSVMFGILGLWQIYCSVTAKRRKRSSVILRLGGFSWDIFSFCRGWLITGQVGTGKTVGAINTMLWQVSKNCPSWGGICID
jgi:hypothetical protein